MMDLDGKSSLVLKWDIIQIKEKIEISKKRTVFSGKVIRPSNALGRAIIITIINIIAERSVPCSPKRTKNTFMKTKERSDKYNIYEGFFPFRYTDILLYKMMFAKPIKNTGERCTKKKLEYGKLNKEDK